MKEDFDGILTGCICAFEGVITDEKTELEWRLAAQPQPLLLGVMFDIIYLPNIIWTDSVASQKVGFFERGMATKCEGRVMHSVVNGPPNTMRCQVSNMDGMTLRPCDLINQAYFTILHLQSLAE